MVKYNSKLVPPGYIAITLFPYVLIRYTKEEVIMKRGQKGHDILVNHEKIHLRQQPELLVLIFYLVYFFNWIVNIFKYKKQAYLNIAFEREAFANESNLDYLNQRKAYSWFRYFRKKNMPNKNFE